MTTSYGTDGGMIVRSNSSPLLALSSIDRLDVLASLFSTVSIPDAVYRETVTHNPILPQRTRIAHATRTFLQIRQPKIQRLFTRNLGDGEQGVLNVALEMSPDVILLDDRKARNEAKECGIVSLLTTEVLKWAEQRRYIQSYQRIIDQRVTQEMYLPE